MFRLLILVILSIINIAFVLYAVASLSYTLYISDRETLPIAQCIYTIGIYYFLKELRHIIGSHYEDMQE